MFKPVLLHHLESIRLAAVSFPLRKTINILFNEKSMYQLIKLRGYYHHIHGHRNKYKRTFLWGVKLIGSERYNSEYKTQSGMGFEAIYRKAVAVDQRISKQQIRRLLSNKREEVYSMSKFSHIIFDAFLSLLAEAIDRKGGLEKCINSLERTVQKANNAEIILTSDIYFFKYLFISQLEPKLSSIGRRNMSPTNRELFGRLENSFSRNRAGIYEGQLRMMN